MKKISLIIGVILISHIAMAGNVKVIKKNSLKNRIEELEKKIDLLINMQNDTNNEKLKNRQTLNDQASCHEKCNTSYPWSETRYDERDEYQIEIDNQRNSCHKDCSSKFDSLIPAELKVFGC